MTRTHQQKTGGGNAQGICSRATGTGGAVGSKCSSRQVRSDRLCPAQDPRQRGTSARSRVSGAGRKLPKISFLSLQRKTRDPRRTARARSDRLQAQTPMKGRRVFNRFGKLPGVFQACWILGEGNPADKRNTEHLFDGPKIPPERFAILRARRGHNDGSSLREIHRRKTAAPPPSRLALPPCACASRLSRGLPAAPARSAGGSPLPPPLGRPPSPALAGVFGVPLLGGGAPRPGLRPVVVRCPVGSGFFPAPSRAGLVLLFPFEGFRRLRPPFRCSVFGRDLTPNHRLERR